MPNVLPTPAFIADKMLEFLFEGSGVVNDVYRKLEAEFTMDKQSIGRAIQVKDPPRVQSQAGPVINTAQSINHGLTTFSIDKWRTVLVKVTGLEKTFNNAKELDIWAEENLKPYVSPLVTDIETDIGQLYKKIPNVVGTPGTGPTTYDPMGAAKERLTLYRTPQDSRVCYLHPSGSRKLGTGLVSVFNPQGPLGNQFTSGKVVPEIAGFATREGNFLPMHTNGSVTTTGANVLTNGANQVGSTIAVDAFTTGTTYEEGDVITFADVYGVDPVSGQSTGQLREFVIRADVTAAGNAANLSISPAVVPSGAFKNITGATADLTGIPDGKAVTLKTGTVSTAYSQNMAWWKNAIGLVTVPILPLEGVKSSVQKTYKGIHLTFSMDGDIMNFETIKRIDLAYGVNIFDKYIDQAVRITN